MKQQKINVPNLITVLRMGFIPLFVVFFLREQKVLAISMLIFFILADKLDGYLARLLNQQSSFGELLDNVADFLFIATILVVLYLTNYLDHWLFWLIATSGIFLTMVNVLIFRKHQQMYSTLLDKMSGSIYFILFLLVYLPPVFKVIAIATIITNISIGLWRMKKHLFHQQ